MMIITSVYSGLSRIFWKDGDKIPNAPIKNNSQLIH